MTRLSHRPPKLRHHEARNLAFVVLDGRTIYLGKWGSSAAKRECAHIIGEWNAGRCGTPHDEPVSDLTITELLAAFMRQARSYYQQSHEADSFVYAIRELKAKYGRLLVAQFSPLRNF